jgi:hypothetical protein
MNCTPSGAPPAIDDASACAMLPKLRAALFSLMAGQARSQIRHGDQWLTFHQGNVKELRAEVRRLELLCGPNAHRGRALRVGSHVPSHAPRRRYTY